MSSEFLLPYGKGALTLRVPEPWQAELVTPAEVPAAPDAAQAVRDALDAPLGGASLADFAGVRSVAIAINDKTRPVPHALLLPPLLERLEGLGVPPEAITLIIATGTHPPMPQEEFGRVVPEEVLARYAVVSHDCDDRENLVYLGETARGTPVWANRRFWQAELRIVVGNVEPHQFAGFSGGVKTAAIGLAGRETVSRNHAMLTDPCAQLGRYADNPVRQDVEAIGRMIGVHFALNAVLNRHKQVVAVVAGEPQAVMEAGVPLVQRTGRVALSAPFDVVIAATGGHPKDLNLYQAQKALVPAALCTRTGGTVILVAACREGIGSPQYEAWMLREDMTSYQAVFERFAQEGFRAGVHKAFLVARDASRVRVILVSEMEPDLVRRLLLIPAASLEEATSLALAGLPADARIGVMPVANAVLPALPEGAAELK